MKVITATSFAALFFLPEARLVLPRQGEHVGEEADEGHEEQGHHGAEQEGEVDQAVGVPRVATVCGEVA